MTHFIDLMADHEWSDRDIRNYCEDWIYTQFSSQDREILSRNIEAARMGLQAMPADKQAELDALQVVLFTAGIMADAARADMSLLIKTKAAEATWRELQALPDTPENANARSQLQVTLDAVDADTAKLLSDRGRCVVQVSS